MDYTNCKIPARLLVKGYVQGVGYRVFVYHIARQMKIPGVIRNLENGDVEIHCKCHDSDHLKDFIDRIEVKSKSKDIYSPNVENIEKKIGDTNVGKYNPPKEYKTFQIDYEDVPPSQKEILLKMDTGSRIMLQTSKSVNSMNHEMVDCFNRLDEKYDSIGTKMEEVHKDLKVISDCFQDLVEYVTVTNKKSKKSKD